MRLTERLLFDAGGWREMRAARELAETGSVLDARQEGPTITGQVAAGGRTYPAGLRWLRPTEAENLCPCKASRDEGVICRHSLAVGVALIRRERNNARAPGGDTGARPAGTRDTGRARAATDPGEPGGSRWPTLTEGPAGQARPIQLRFILPRDVPAALTGDGAVVTVEGRVLDADGRPGDWRPAPAVIGTPESGPVWMDPGEISQAEWLRALSPDGPPGLLRLDPADFADLLTRSVGLPNLLPARGSPLDVSFGDPALRARLVRVDSRSARVEPRRDGPRPVLVGDSVLLVEDGRVTIPGLSCPPGMLATLLSGNPVPWTSPEAPVLADVLRTHFTLDNPEDLPGFQPTSPRFHFRLAGSLRTLRCHVRIAPGPSDRAGEPTPIPADKAFPGLVFPAPPGGGDADFLTVSPDSIQPVLDILRAGGFQADSHDGSWILRGEDAVVGFLASGLPRLRRAGAVDLQESLEKETDRVDVLTIRATAAPAGSSWFTLTTRFESNGRGIPPNLVDQLLRSGKSSLKRPDGRIIAADTATLNDFHEAVRDINASQSAPQAYRVPAAEIPFLSASLGQTVAIPPTPRPDHGTSATRVDQVIQSLPVRLRDYQITGVHWIIQTLESQGGGLLGDEMGLGKTIQSLAAIACLGFPTLIVCPASLTNQWINECQAVLPRRKCVVLKGDNIKQVAEYKCDTEIFIVSYGILREWAGLLRKRSWRVAVFDEAQTLRNPKSQTTRACASLTAAGRLALTGTPVENRLTDLWSLMQVVRPGALGDLAHFQQRYGSGTPDSGRRLRRRLGERMLRREKREVAAELPTKTVQTVPCAMSGEQAAVYRDLLEGARIEVARADSGNSLAPLTALLRLRQAALDPRLLGRAVPGAGRTLPAGGKLDVLSEIIKKTSENKKKALVYSNFSTYLQLLAVHFDAMGIACCHLDGSTRDRQAQVDRFQSDSSVGVFLISLKAGGLGLNLTAADVVVHMDPWWNPAAEEQANDRAHRIGRRRPVHILKLISQGTVDEGILTLQERKRRIHAAVIATGGGNPEPATAITREEIAALITGHDAAGS